MVAALSRASIVGSCCDIDESRGEGSMHRHGGPVCDAGWCQWP